MFGALFPDELQSEESKTLLSQALAGTVKSKSGIKHDRASQGQFHRPTPGRRRRVVGGATALDYVPAAAGFPACGSEGKTSAPAVDAKSAPAELTSRIEQRDTTLAELVRAKEYWEACASERAALLEELRNRLRGQDSAVENLRRESEALKASLERQAKEHPERQSELKELIRAKEYWEGCAGERAALLEEQKNRLREQDCAVENLRRESEALKGFCKARVAELAANAHLAGAPS